MALPAIAGAFTKGLLGAGARGAATGGARAMAGQAAKGAAKQGFKKFAQGMTGKTSDDYKARVDGINPETGEYLTPEERKARFKGFSVGTKPGAQKLLSGGPTQTVAALPPAGGVGADSTSDTQTKTVNHLEKIQMYLEKLLKIEESALARLQDRILETAKEDERDAAAAEESRQEKGKPKEDKRKGNPVIQGMKKKAGGIFQFLMDLGMKFIGFKILDWLSDPENKKKIDTVVGFFQGVWGFLTAVGTAIGDGWNWTVETVEAGIEGIKSFAKGIEEFFTFEWLDIDGMMEQFNGFITFFTEGVKNVLDDAINWVSSIPQLFSQVGDFIVGSFMDFLGIPREEEEITLPMPDPSKDVENDTTPQTVKIPGHETKEGTVIPGKSDNEGLPQMGRGGALTGPSHAGGGVNINAEGGEYVLNKKAVAAIGTRALDRINFGMFPSGYKGPGMGAGGHVVTSTMGNRSFALSPGMHMGVDISTGVGEKLQAINAGVVEGVGYDGGYGNYVSWVDSKTGLGNFYAHMNQPARVKVGQRVNKGTVLGYTGNTGRSSGPHLHWETATNPADTGRSKSAVLSRINPLSKYNKEAPFGGTETAVPTQPGEKTDLSADPPSEQQKAKADGSTTTPTPTQPKLSKEALILNAANSLAEMMGGKAVNTEDILSNLQNENNRVTGEQESAAETTTETVNLDQSGSFQTGMDVDYDVPSLGFNFPPFYQAFFPLNP